MRAYQLIPLSAGTLSSFLSLLKSSKATSSREPFLLPGSRSVHPFLWVPYSPLSPPPKSVPEPLRTQIPFKTSASTSVSCISGGQGLSVVKCLFTGNMAQSPWAVTIQA